MRIEVSGSVPRAFGLAKAQVVAAARFFAARSRARVGGVWHEVVVHLVDDAASDAIHRAIMGIAGVTDVVTQAYDAIPPETPGLYGEIFVNTDQARRAAPKRRGWSVAKELLLYVAHGMDHLSGADDHAECDYRAMRRRELSWLKVEKWKSGRVEEGKSGKVEEGEGAINVIL
jgi:probable rRNA maturation factor